MPNEMTDRVQMVKMWLTDTDIRIIRNMIRLVDQMPSCADELLYCTQDEYNSLGEMFDD